MNNSELYPLFPSVVYKNSLDRKLTTDELSFINSCKSVNQNLGNEISDNLYILDQIELHDLKTELMKHVNNYLNNIIMSDVELYITNSWINYNNTYAHHALHNHNNSIISGVFYVDVEDSQPTISFNRMTPPFLLLMKAKKYTMMNAMEWNIPISNLGILLFPSQCFHFVKPNLSSNKRISIAFNTFLRGKIGGDYAGADLTLI
jgi:uncharacterized protein (TIGR02466 family)